MTEPNSEFKVQADVRAPWRTFLDEIAPLRPELHRYCYGLTGNLWDGEDLMQDVFLRVFGLLGKIDRNLTHPRAYLIQTATHLWIDRVRRLGIEQKYAAVSQETEIDDQEMEQVLRVREAATSLFATLPPQERACVLLKDVLDLSLQECATMLKTSVGAVKSALHRGRTRLRSAAANLSPSAKISQEVLEQFIAALAKGDIEGLRGMCRADVSIELVGGNIMEGFETGKAAFEHALWVMPEMGLGENPRWEVTVYQGEPIAVGFRTRNDKEGLNEVWRLIPGESGIAHVRLYCFCPDTLHTLAGELSLRALRRPHRSP